MPAAGRSPAATLQLGNGGASGAITGNVADNATVAFDRSDAVIFAGTIAGTGTLAPIGNGTTMLTAASTYAGGTAIAAGTLVFGKNASLGTGTAAMAPTRRSASRRPAPRRSVNWPICRAPPSLLPLSCRRRDR